MLTTQWPTRCLAGQRCRCSWRKRGRDKCGCQHDPDKPQSYGRGWWSSHPLCQSHSYGHWSLLQKNQQRHFYQHCKTMLLLTGTFKPTDSKQRQINGHTVCFHWNVWGRLLPALFIPREQCCIPHRVCFNVPISHEFLLWTALVGLCSTCA